MKIVDYKQIDCFIKKHNQSKTGVLLTYRKLKSGSFKSCKEIVAAFPRSSIRKGKNDEIVFRIKGNDFRMIIKFSILRQIGRILFVGTHAEYDKYIK